MISQRYEIVSDIVAQHDVANYHLVFAFIADWTNCDDDVAVKAFYDNNCDIAKACLALEIYTRPWAPAPRPKKWLANFFKRLFLCCGAAPADGAWYVSSPLMFKAR